MKRTSGKKQKRKSPKATAAFDAALSASLSGGAIPAKAEPSTEIVEPSREAVARYETIPLLFDSSTSRQVLGRIAYDSRAHGQPVGLRDVTDGYVRRLSFACGKITVDLVAERREKHWEFVARAYSDGAVAHDFVLQVGGRKFLAASGGFFHWSSRSVPRRFRLVSYGQTVLFEGVSWR